MGLPIIPYRLLWAYSIQAKGSTFRMLCSFPRRGIFSSCANRFKVTHRNETICSTYQISPSSSSWRPSNKGKVLYSFKKCGRHTTGYCIQRPLQMRKYSLNQKSSSSKRSTSCNIVVNTGAFHFIWNSPRRTPGYGDDWHGHECFERALTIKGQCRRSWLQTHDIASC